MRLFKNKYFAFAIGFLFLIGVWFLVNAIVDLNNMIFPSPFNTFKRMFELLGLKSTYKYLGFSISRLVVGFLASFVLAFLLGMIVNNSEFLYNFFTPVITFLKASPTATFVFVFLVLFGGRNAPAWVVVLMTFPILYESIVSALRSTPIEMLEASRIDGAGKLKTLIRVQIPLGIPFISLGLLSTFGMAFKVEIMAEIITGITKGGIGTMIKISNLLDGTDLTNMFAYSLMAIILVLIVSIIASIVKGKINTPKAIKVAKE